MNDKTEIHPGAGIPGMNEPPVLADFTARRILFFTLACWAAAPVAAGFIVNAGFRDMLMAFVVLPGCWVAFLSYLHLPDIFYTVVAAVMGLGFIAAWVHAFVQHKRWLAVVLFAYLVACFAAGFFLLMADVSP